MLPHKESTDVRITTVNSIETADNHQKKRSWLPWRLTRLRLKCCGSRSRVHHFHKADVLRGDYRQWHHIELARIFPLFLSRDELILNYL